jgi:predicted nucleic acid-binding protein
MTLALDATALVARHVAEPARATAVAAMDADPVWCASALALAEALVLVERLTDDPSARDVVRRAVVDDWQRVWVVPVDQPCLDRAAELMLAHPVRTADAIHLAAAERLPRPVTYVTFDPHQIPVALALGLDLASA